MDYSKLDDKIGFTFKNKDLLNQVFLHRSYFNEHPEIKIASNERLEFLGDSILSLIVAEYFFFKKKKAAEGELTNLRSLAVRTETLAKASEKLGLGEFLLLSKGEDESGGRGNPTLLANVFEAMVGAIYLEKGIQFAKKFVNKNLLLSIDELTQGQEVIDYKSQLQKVIQQKSHLSPTYKLLLTTGPDHNKTFTVGVYFQEELIGKGQGKSKQQAEQKAAFGALKSTSLTQR